MTPMESPQDRERRLSATVTPIALAAAKSIHDSCTNPEDRRACVFMAVAILAELGIAETINLSPRLDSKKKNERKEPILITKCM